MPHTRLQNGEITKEDILAVAKRIAIPLESPTERDFDTAYAICSMFGYTPAYVLLEARELYNKGQKWKNVSSTV